MAGKNISKDKITINRSDYDSLCDALRHILTLTKKVDKLSDKIYTNIADLSSKAMMERKILAAKIEDLEKIFNKLNMSGDQNES